jgi:hypothetical protein
MGGFTIRDLVQSFYDLWLYGDLCTANVVGVCVANISNIAKIS